MIRLVLLVLSIVALDKAAQAGMTVTVSDTCTAAERAAEKPGPFDGNMVIPGRAFAPQDLTIHEPGPQTLRHPCAGQFGAMQPWSSRQRELIATDSH